MDEYSKLVRSEVRIRLEQMRFFGGVNVTNPELQCTFTLHRGHCSHPAITVAETIAWNTRICFLWRCPIPEHAMRVENCWAGSKHNPVYLLTPQGCSSETAMISSPTYDRDMRRATSLGWLAVRQVGVRYLRVSCDIRLCHLCDENCSLITPPIGCRDYSQSHVSPSNLCCLILKLQPPIGCRDYSQSYAQNRERMFWNASSEVAELCYPTMPPVNSSPSLSCSVLLFLVSFLMFVNGCCQQMGFTE
ncbi:unnamed protein product [Toxocara canis]|uniref:ZP domain-containing protein n=1 Tax=Toxocara canis TaxID=6265 RepID=A0A183VD74_TOXCA|nr:unnamed protein product [Toxocara canis]